MSASSSSSDAEDESLFPSPPSSDHIQDDINNNALAGAEGTCLGQQAAIRHFDSYVEGINGRSTRSGRSRFLSWNDLLQTKDVEKLANQLARYFSVWTKKGMSRKSTVSAAGLSISTQNTYFSHLKTLAIRHCPTLDLNPERQDRTPDAHRAVMYLHDVLRQNRRNNTTPVKKRAIMTLGDVERCWDSFQNQQWESNSTILLQNLVAWPILANAMRPSNLKKINFEDLIVKECKDDKDQRFRAVTWADSTKNHSVGWFFLIENTAEPKKCPVAMFLHYVKQLGSATSVSITTQQTGRSIRLLKNDLWRAPRKDNTGFMSQVIGERHFDRLFLRFLVCGGICDNNGLPLTDSDKEFNDIRHLFSQTETFGSYSGRRTHASLAVMSKEVSLSHIMAHTGHKTESAFWEYVGRTPEEMRDYLVRTRLIKALTDTPAASSSSSTSSSAKRSSPTDGHDEMDERTSKIVSFSSNNTGIQLVFNSCSLSCSDVAALLSQAKKDQDRPSTD